MARIWPLLGLRAHVTARLVGEGALAAMLAVALAFSWSDGTPNPDPFRVVVQIRSGIASMQVSGNNLYSGKPFLIPKPLAPTPVAQAPVPTAPPVELLIPSLNVHRAVEAVGADRSGVLNVPVNAWNGGWFNGSPVPGAPGDTVIEGHAGYPGQPMIFGRLGQLRPGDQIIVVTSDGIQRLFLVESMARVPVGSSPPGMAEPFGPPRLTLITCTGHFDANSYTYSERLVLEASYAGLV